MFLENPKIKLPLPLWNQLLDHIKKESIEIDVSKIVNNILLNNSFLHVAKRLLKEYPSKIKLSFNIFFKKLITIFDLKKQIIVNEQLKNEYFNYKNKIEEYHKIELFIHIFKNNIQKPNKLQSNTLHKLFINNLQLLNQNRFKFPWYIITRLEILFNIMKNLSLEDFFVNEITVSIKDNLIDENCPICLEKITKQNGCMTKCKHCFHKNCLKEYIKQSCLKKIINNLIENQFDSFKIDCPYCRQNIFIIVYLPWI